MNITKSISLYCWVTFSKIMKEYYVYQYNIAITEPKLLYKLLALFKSVDSFYEKICLIIETRLTENRPVLEIGLTVSGNNQNNTARAITLEYKSKFWILEPDISCRIISLHTISPCFLLYLYQQYFPVHLAPGQRDILQIKERKNFKEVSRAGSWLQQVERHAQTKRQAFLLLWEMPYRMKKRCAPYWVVRRLQTVSILVVPPPQAQASDCIDRVVGLLLWGGGGGGTRRIDTVWSLRTGINLTRGIIDFNRTSVTSQWFTCKHYTRLSIISVQEYRSWGGLRLKRGTLPLEEGSPPHEAFFHFASWLQKKEPKSSFYKRQWCLWTTIYVHSPCTNS